jgi:hypothetical protein
MCPRDSGASCDLLHGDVRRGSGARRAIVDPPGARLCVGDEFPQGFPGRICPHHHAKGVAGQGDDVGEIFGGIEARGGHEGVAEHSDW